MQKALHPLNLHLTDVISDITGVTGMKIVRAIVAIFLGGLSCLPLIDPSLPVRTA
jgi:hypothetical protein